MAELKTATEDTCLWFFWFMFNIILWFFGTMVLGAGLWLKLDEDLLDLVGFVDTEDTGKALVNGIYILMVLGAFIFLGGMLGVLGAICINSYLLSFYVFLMIITLIIQMMLGILVLVFRGTIENEFRENWLVRVYNDTYQDLHNDPEPHIRYTSFGRNQNLIQWEMECCGVNGAQDYQISTQWPKSVVDGSMVEFPYTCCVLIASTTNPRDVQADGVRNAVNCYNHDNTQDVYFWDKGCYSKIIDWVNGHIAVMASLSAWIMLMEIFAIMFGTYLTRRVDLETNQISGKLQQYGGAFGFGFGGDQNSLDLGGGSQADLAFGSQADLAGGSNANLAY